MIAKVYHVVLSEFGYNYGRSPDEEPNPIFPNDYAWVANVEVYCEDGADINILLDEVFRITNNINGDWIKNRQVVLCTDQRTRSTCVDDVVELYNKFYICNNIGWEEIQVDLPEDNDSDVNYIKAQYDDGECPDCGEGIPGNIVDGERCSNCGHVFSSSPIGPQITTFSHNADGTGSGNLVVDMSDISPGSFLEIHITEEGIIYDLWNRDSGGNIRCVGSNAQTYVEISEDILERFENTDTEN